MGNCFDCLGSINPFVTFSFHIAMAFHPAIQEYTALRDPQSQKNSQQ